MAAATDGRRTDEGEREKSEGKHGVAKIFAKARRRVAGKPAVLFWDAGRRSKSSGADYGLPAHEDAYACAQNHTTANM